MSKTNKIVNSNYIKIKKFHDLYLIEQLEI